MSTHNKLYKCYKEGCYFRQDHTDGPFLTQMEYDDLLKDGVLNCPEGNLNCGLQELKPEDYPKPPKAKLNPKLIAAIAAGLLVIGAVVFFITRPSSAVEEPLVSTEEVQEMPVETPVLEEPESTPEPEPVKVEESAPAAKPQPKTDAGSAPKGTLTLNLDGNTYKGEVQKGKAHGLGTLYYLKSTQISPKDLKKRMAEAGDYVTGEFYEGALVQGKLFDKNNELKEIITIGR